MIPKTISFSTKNSILGFKAQEARNSSLSGVKEDPASIAYLITVNGRASRQVKRLIRVLYHPTHLFYIHVDAVIILSFTIYLILIN